MVQRDFRAWRLLFVWCACFATLAWCLRDSLFFGTALLGHDNFYWGYPVYHYLASALVRGEFPFWNPYSHGGEPFYPIPGQIRLLEPLVLPVALLARLVGFGSVQAFVWNRVVGSLVMAAGAYRCLARYARGEWAQIALVPALLLSTFMLGSFQQDGLFSQFVWIPYVYWYFTKIFEDGENTLPRWLGLGAFLGLNQISYFMGGSWLFLTLLGVLWAVFRRERFTRTWRAPGTLGRAATAAFVVAAMSLPCYALYRERNQYVYPPRMFSADAAHPDRPLGAPMPIEGDAHSLQPPLKMPYALVVSTGTFAHVWDYVITLFPRSNVFLRWDRHFWIGEPSEASFYVGVVGWLVGLGGLAYGRHYLRGIWLTLLGFYALLALGPTGGILPLLYPVVPLLWFVRHMHTFGLFVHWAFFYFLVLGFDWLELGEPEPRAPSLVRVTIASALFAVVQTFFFTATTAAAEVPAYIFVPAALFVVLAALVLTRLFGTRAFLVPGTVAAQALLIWSNAGAPESFLREMAVFGALPLALAGLAACHSRRWAAGVLAAALFVNLAYGLTWYTHFYHQPAPYPSSFAHYTWPETRAVALVPHTEDYVQAMRYEEWFEGRAYTFSSLFLQEPAKLPPPASPEFFARARKVHRWNSFVLLKSYFTLEQGDLPSPVLASFFGVGGPLFGFREAPVALPAAAWPGFFRGLGENAPAFLARYWMSDELVPEAREASAAAASLREPNVPPRFSFRVMDSGVNFVHLAVESDRAGFLYWADGFHDSWRAARDGEATPLFRANGGFKAVALPAGRHEFFFRFFPRFFAFSLLAYYVSFFSALGVALVASRPRAAS